MILVCVATPMEGNLLMSALGGKGAGLVPTGIGPVNAAHAVTLRLARGGIDAVISCGIGGAYPGSDLEIGDVVCAESECYGDLGAAAPDGFQDMQQLGFPVIAGDPPLFNTLPLDLFPCEHRARFVTLSTCTGTDAAAREIAGRTGGSVESMEGAAIVHVARLHGVRVGEIRGVSNAVGDRDRARWRVKEAAEAAQRALLRWIGS